MRDNIALVVILYNDYPKEYIFENNHLNRIIVDNTPNRDLSLNGNNLHYIPLKDNFGIAKALNIGFAKAKELEAKWVLTMDQDSELPKNMIDEYKHFINDQHHDIGIVSPIINMYIGESKRKSNTFEEINEALTSGSLVNMQAYDAAGGFKEEMFIDSVDFEFCWNIKSKGYIIYRLNSVVMQHQLGNTREFKLFGHHLFYVTNHNYIRRYYMTRNCLYVNNLYGHIMPRPKFPFIAKLTSLLKIIFFENDVLRKIKVIRIAKRDFKNNKFGKFDYHI